MSRVNTELRVRLSKRSPGQSSSANGEAKMLSHPTTRRFAFTLSLIFLASSPAFADNYRDRERHFSLELPDGWQVMTDQEIAQLNKARLPSSWTPKLMITTGFRLCDGAE